MIQIKDKEACCGCHACFQICPVQAIQMKADEEGFLYPVVDLNKCIGCNRCVQVCPEYQPAAVSKDSKVYACYRTDLKERLKSASGGLFAVLAENVIEHHGVVFGAAFHEDWELRHCPAENTEQLSKLLGSKYVQSKIGTSFKEAREYLNGGRVVLFSGTPCQIQGLKQYLGKEYCNLITVDLVCHGVPSPDVWKSYLDEISKGRKLVKYVPRDKSNGIGNAPLLFVFDNQEQRKENYNDSLYMRGFCENLFLRPSCYQCSFKGIERCSDITLGDFWGIENYKPEFYDQFGISLALLHTEKGAQWFDKIQDQINAVACDAEQAIAQNPCLIKSVQKSEHRESFFEYWKQTGVQKTVRKISKRSVFQRMEKLKNISIYYLWRLKKRVWNVSRERG